MLPNPYINARLGKGCIFKTSTNTNYYANFSEGNKDIIDLKYSIFSKNHPASPLYTLTYSKKSYIPGKNFYRFYIRSSEIATEYASRKLEDVISELTIPDLLMLYLDRGGMCGITGGELRMHSLNDDNASQLSEKINSLFGIPDLTYPLQRHLRGVARNYIYFPQRALKVFKPIVENFLILADYESLLYKVGSGQKKASLVLN